MDFVTQKWYNNELIMENEESPQNGNENLNAKAEHFDATAFLEEAELLQRGQPRTWGATPGDRMNTLQQQLGLVIDLQQLTYRDIPDDVDMEMVDYVHTTFTSRFHARAEANEENYMTALNAPNDVFSPEMIEMFTRAELGHASPAELLLTRQLKGIRSVELACLTHPYGKRIEEYLEEMREAVQSQVEYMGGEYYDEPRTRYRVKEIIGYEKGEAKFDKGVLMTRKRALGMMPDGTIIRERSSFVLRLDAAVPLTDREREALKGVDLSQLDWQDKLVAAGNLDEIADLLMKVNEYSLAIPIATTIYAYNPETARLVEERAAAAAAERKADFAEEFPILAAAMTGEQNKLRVAEFRGGMFYSGPSEPSEAPIELFDK